MATTIATTMVTTDYLYAANAAIINAIATHLARTSNAYHYVPTTLSLFTATYLPTPTTYPTPYYFTIIVT